MHGRQRRRLGHFGSLWLWGAAAALIGLYLGRRRARSWALSLADALRKAALDALSEIFHDEAA